MRGLVTLRLLRESVRKSISKTCRSGVVWALVTALCGMALAPMAQAQNPGGEAPPIPAGGTQINIPPPPPSRSGAGLMQSASDLVRIDIQVTDKNGKTIKGLRPDQFTITDNGKEQKISSFSFEDIEAVQTAGV